MFERIANLIDMDLGQPTAVRAIIAGMCLSIGITQYLKFRPAFSRLSDIQYRLIVRSIAALTAFVFTWVLWPAGDILAGAVMGLAVGAITPVIYAIAIRRLYRHAPHIEVVMSGRPGTKDAIAVDRDDLKIDPR